MVKSKAIYHAKNPYGPSQQQYTAAIFAPNDYRLSLMTAILPAVAIRVLMIMGAKVQPDCKVHLSVQEIARIMQTDSTYVSKGIAVLLKYDFIARHKQGEYWVSPSVFQPMIMNH